TPAAVRPDLQAEHAQHTSPGGTAARPALALKGRALTHIAKATPTNRSAEPITQPPGQASRPAATTPTSVPKRDSRPVHRSGRRPHGPSVDPPENQRTPARPTSRPRSYSHEPPGAHTTLMT